MYTFENDEELIQFLKENLTIKKQHGYYDTVDIEVKFKKVVILDECVCL